MTARTRPASAITGPATAQKLTLDMTLPPRTPMPCRVKTTPASMRRNPAPTSTTRLMMPPSGSRCLAVTCSDLPDHGQAISRGLPPAGQGGGPAALLTAVRQLIRTERSGGSVSGQLFAPARRSSVEKHVNAVYTKLGLSAEQNSHRGSPPC